MGYTVGKNRGSASDDEQQDVRERALFRRVIWRWYRRIYHLCTGV